MLSKSRAVVVAAATALGVVVAPGVAHAAETVSPQVIRVDGGGPDQVSAISVDAAGNIYLGGSSVVKLDPQGEVLWRAGVNASAIAVSDAGDVYVAGTVSDGAIFNANIDFDVVKLSPNGVKVWERTYDNGGRDLPKRIAVDERSGAVYVSGISIGSGFDWVTLKFASDGSKLWSRRVSGSGVLDDFVSDMAVAPSGDVVVAGVTKNNADDPLNDDAEIVTYDPQGGIVWQRRFSATDISFETVGDIDIDDAGRVIVSSSSAPNSNPEFGQAFATSLSLLYDATGNLLQTVPAGGQAAGTDEVGNFYLAGTFLNSTESSVVAKYDAAGNEVWRTALTTASHEGFGVTGLVVDAQGAVTLAGDLVDRITLKRDFLTIHFAPDGTESWRHRFNGTGDAEDSVAGVAIDGQEAVLVAGTTANGGFTSNTDVVTLRFPAGTVPGSAPPAAPSQLTATGVSRSQIELTWRDNADTEVGFVIERCQGQGCTNFAQVATVGRNVVQFVDDGLSRNTSYVYRVKAFNDAGASAFTSTATARTRR